MTIAILLLLAVCVVGKLAGKNEYETLGVVLLDSLTFHKVVPSPTHTVVVLVCNKKEIGEYATDSIRGDFLDFAAQSEYKGNADEQVLFAQVIVNGAQNLKLAERIGAPADFKHPQMFLYKPNAKIPLRYPKASPFNQVALTRWVSKHSNFYFGLPGLIQTHDALAEKFMAASSEDQSSIIEECREAVASVELKDRDNAEYYCKLMKNIDEKGSNFVPTEIARLQSILDSDKVSDKKKSEIEIRINIVHQFDRITPDL